ncbi:type II secretion system protein [Campylobacter fetus]|nr:prepilin-type N-terminal cleavage/methylation domain-containing protein [Campylobacter fetus]EAJ0328353.1 prepilin-type N-terminal cleavage/methylation domain-containing protein [Campylobacter fetus]KAA8731525.1 prepilin-type N-terminal cleavage/methylation domain-containing protein [Campylobacter fetus subsp. fetus]MPB30826.1 prepilin-type N-terminal cleavage/methylation domain-containing protein [Campylobacter fetus]MPB50611.1 prepilin-type N-terminal cleavage/methylation domain-containing
MKKGFTMIELVFVIVILGILAGIAIPRLAATRDDASATKAAMEIKDVITQVAAYYTINGKWAEAAVTGTGADAIINTSGQDITGATYSATDKGLSNLSSTLNAVLGRTGNAPDQWDACISITPNNTNGNIVIAAKADATSYCNTVRLVPAVKDWIELGKTTGIIIGGSGIYK